MHFNATVHSGVREPHFGSVQFICCERTYGCESWTLGKSEETRLDAFEMKGLRKILRVSWTAKKTNE